MKQHECGKLPPGVDVFFDGINWNIMKRKLSKHDTNSLIAEISYCPFCGLELGGGAS